MKPTPSPHDEKIVELLKRLGTLKAEYPADLLAARRAAFAAQIEESRNARAQQASPSQDKIIQLLEGLQPVGAEYPPDLLASRRAAFIAQIEQYNRSEVQ